MGIIQLFKPEQFQGNLKSKKYFEGWYLKHVSLDHKHSVAFIPGVSLTPNDAHSFVQYIDGINGVSHYFRFPLTAFKATKGKFEVRIDKNSFSKDGMQLDLDDGQLKIKGKLQYKNSISYPSKRWSPGIMGWYSFVPFMECYHGVVSVQHNIEGALWINNESINFDSGNGYIEKDWGRSFPESWIWLHCNSFEEKNQSLMFSVAKIPWLGRFFMGFLCFLYIDGQFYRFTTYNRSKIDHISKKDNRLYIEFRNASHTLRIEVVQNESADLKAPASGKMNRVIKESIDSNCKFSLYNASNTKILEGSGERAGLEIIDSIFDYF